MRVFLFIEIAFFCKDIFRTVLHFAIDHRRVDVRNPLANQKQTACKPYRGE